MATQDAKRSRKELSLGACTLTTDAEEWTRRGVRVPKFDVKRMREKTRAEGPQWIHFAPSNLFVAEIAPRAQHLLESGHLTTGIVGVETWDAELVTRVYRPHDNLRLRVIMPPSGDRSVEVVASVADALAAESDQDWLRVLAYFASKNLQMVSVTCTEKGYGLGFAKADMEAGPRRPTHLMAVVAACAFQRYQNGAAPIAFVSMDNCSENGRLFRESVLAVAEAWHKGGKLGGAGEGFLKWLSDRGTVAFPWTMIDRISPYPGDAVEAYLRERLCIGGMKKIETAKRGVFAPFANTEHVSYLVIQDCFPNGRPPLERTGVIFCADEKEVGDFERMKVGTCLNPLHTTLAIFGCLLGHTSIAEEMKDADIVGLLRGQAKEALPKVVRPKCVTSDDSPVAPENFLKTCLEERFPNPSVPDTPQRIATDTSQKVGVRYGGTLSAYGPAAHDLQCIPVAVAGWVRYLAGMRAVGKEYVGTRDDGESFPIRPDPELSELAKYAGTMTFGKPDSVTSEAVAGILRIGFPEGLPDGVAAKVAAFTRDMMRGAGGVRSTVRKVIS
eukprot:TRINITY_DN6367_c1_g1_i1.p1 TRINITY_DN6367_c1_g1~~TRINITY_DN6367_c1_g1_i1.p1  ORF type:complete len:557 (+),score=113.56 TRINITY_DN6367_c1_g1_i1:57-1727(+)